MIGPKHDYRLQLWKSPRCYQMPLTGIQLSSIILHCNESLGWTESWANKKKPLSPRDKSFYFSNNMKTQKQKRLSELQREGGGNLKRKLELQDTINSKYGITFLHYFCCNMISQWRGIYHTEPII